MGATEQRLIQHIDELLEKGDRVLASERETLPSLDWPLYHEWEVQSLSFLFNTLGNDHVYAQRFRHAVEDAWGSGIRGGLGILRGLREDFEKGYLSTLRELANAAVFADFLEMAKYLLTEHYEDAAAVLIGGVLEDHLRQLCRKYGIPVEVQTSKGKKPKKAERMNEDLAKARAYMITDQKNVTAWLDLRNKAAHAEYNQYSHEEIRLLLLGVTDFLARYPA